jgi:phosphatidylinositol alpha 1,6-mannosyltransferase
MASGLPVVAVDAGGPRELVASGATGLLVPVGDAAALRAAVRRLRDDPGLRGQFGRSARVAVLDRTWDTVCAELLGHYAAVCEGPAARRAA